MEFSSITQPPGIEKRVARVDWLARLAACTTTARRLLVKRVRNGASGNGTAIGCRRLARDLGVDIVRARFGDLSRTTVESAEWRRSR